MSNKQPSISQSVFRHVESLLYDYPDILKEIGDLREDIINAANEQPEVYAKASGISDPTSMRATLLVSHRRLRLLETAKDAIEKVYNRLPVEKQKMVELKYWDKHYSDIGVAKAIPTSRESLYRWRRQIIKAIAVELGWVKLTQK